MHVSDVIIHVEVAALHLAIVVVVILVIPDVVECAKEHVEVIV